MDHNKWKKWEWKYAIYQRSKSFGAVSARPRVTINSIYTDCYKSTPKESDTAHRRKKIHNCAGCQKSFGWPEILKRRMETHNRERIFNCVQCKKSFGSAGHLNQHICSPLAEKRCKFAQNATSYLALWKRTCSSTVEKSPHLLRIQEVIWSSRTFEGTHDHPQQRKSIRLCPMPKVIWSSYIFEKTHAHSQWSEGPLLLRMWEVISSSRTFEEAHDHPHWGESTHLCPMPKVIWSGWLSENTHAHPQRSENPHLLRM